jgi:hypothetical protein
MGAMAEALQGTLSSPGGSLGSRSARQGQPGTRHLPQAVCVLHPAHGRLLEGGAGAWDGGTGAPNATPTPCGRVGGGGGGGGRASRLHGEWSPWRRPRACGRRADKEESAHQVPSERARCPRACLLVEAGDMASHTGAVLWRPPQGQQTRHGTPWRSTTGGEPWAVHVARTVLNGGDGETCSNGTRLVPTQLGHWRRLRPSVRVCRDKPAQWEGV